MKIAIYPCLTTIGDCKYCKADKQLFITFCCKAASRADSGVFFYKYREFCHKLNLNFSQKDFLIVKAFSFFQFPSIWLTFIFKIKAKNTVSIQMHNDERPGVFL